jgi:hypothetical protein
VKIKKGMLYISIVIVKHMKNITSEREEALKQKAVGETEKWEKDLPKYKVNPLMQMSRHVLTLQSHPMLMHKINRTLSPGRKSYSIW